jgi:putative flavoprotein involved in K+ transport
MSRCLLAAGLPHVVLERGRIGQRWRGERWDSLRLLTPRWQSRLPAFPYEGSDPDGYMTKDEVVAHLERYAKSFAAPVEEGVEVLALRRGPSGYRAETSRGVFEAPAVVIATGNCDVPAVPEAARSLPAALVQMTSTTYKRPGELPPGGVLVVGASATGVQLADEIHRSGRPVTLAVGRHTRFPRSYRGRDIMWWLDALGVLDETVIEVSNLAVARRLPSTQLVGRPDHATLDLPALLDRGIRLTGRFAGAKGSRLAFADDLAAQAAAADARLVRLLRRIDAFAARTGLERALEPRPRFRPFPWSYESPTELDVETDGLASVIWATGFKRLYPWLELPVLDSDGEIRHEGGVTPLPGLYVLGLNFLKRRNSSFLDGVGRDAFELAAHLTAFLRRAA